MGGSTESDEVTLVQQVSQGDRAAYEVLVDRQLPSLARYVSRMLGNAADAEDITQEVFLRLWTHADRYDPAAAKLNTWLHNIAHNLCIDFFRKHNRFADDPPNDDMDGGEEPDGALLASLTSEAVSTQISALPERQRSALVMCHYQGLSNKDAAEILDVSVDALESILARARRTLRKNLSEAT